MSKLIAKDRICRNTDGDIVPCDDPTAAFVVVTAGHEVPSEYVAKVKAFLGDQPDEPEADADGDGEADEKQAPKAANKAKPKAANK